MNLSATFNPSFTTVPERKDFHLVKFQTVLNVKSYVKNCGPQNVKISYLLILDPLLKKAGLYIPEYQKIDSLANG